MRIFRTILIRLKNHFIFCGCLSPGWPRRFQPEVFLQASRPTWTDLFVSEGFSRISFKWFVLERRRRTWASRCQWPAVEIDKSRWDFRRCKPDRRRSLPLVKYHKVGICKIVDINLGQNSMGICKWLRSSLVQKKHWRMKTFAKPSDQNVMCVTFYYFCVSSLPYLVKLSLKHLVPYS